MAVCVIGTTWDTDSGQVVPACNVHCHYAPCPLNGEPARPGAIETTDEQGREKALQFWDARTKRQRPLVLHHGSWLDDRDHAGAACWCGPDLLPVVSVHPEGGTA
jgi:hypothetical protein